MPTNILNNYYNNWKNNHRKQKIIISIFMKKYKFGKRSFQIKISIDLYYKIKRAS